jgi:MFS family permease
MSENVVVGIPEPAVEQKPRINPLTNRNFRLLWMGENVSLLGDQFYMVALPLLVFDLTGSKLAFGTILMVGGIPRAVLMLLGGVLTDRISPQKIMVNANIARLVITIIVALLVFTHTTQVWMLYVIALAFGISDAFFQPASMAMIPAITDEDGLQASNAAMQGTMLSITSIGPAIAGLIVSTFGMVFSFVFDAATFLFTSVTLSMMDLPAAKNDEKTKPKVQRGVMAEIGEAFTFMLNDPILKPLMLVIVAINFLFTGPMMVGPASLAKDSFTSAVIDGTASSGMADTGVALGMMLSAFGIGSLLGMIAGGTLKPRKFGVIVMAVLGFAGICIAGLGYVTTLPAACVLFALMGATTGFTNVLMITWLQRKIVKEMMGRMMSLVMLAGMGLAPLSSAVAGLIAERSLPLMFVSAGVLLLITSLLSLLNPHVRSLQEN